MLESGREADRAVQVSTASLASRKDSMDRRETMQEYSKETDAKS